MKKKILFALLLVAMFTLAFAISASASEFKSHFDVDVTSYGEGPDWVNVADTDATVVLKVGEGFVRVPTAYVFKANGNNQFVVNGSNFDFAWISGKLGENVTLENLVALELPEGTVSISGAISHTTFTALEELVIPTTVTSVGSFMLRNNAVLKYVFVRQTKDAEGNVQGLTSLPQWFADCTNGVTALEEFVFELDYVTFIANQAFEKSNLKFFKATGPMTVNNSAFSGCKMLEWVELNNTGDNVVIGSKVLGGCTNIKSVVLNNFSLPDYLFENSNGLTGGMTFVATNVKTIGQQIFKNCTNVSTIKISGPITFTNGNIFGIGSSSSNIENIELINTLDTPVSTGNSFCEKFKKLKSVKLQGFSVGSKAFFEVNGTDMVVTITNCGYIGESAFQNADNITELYIEGDFQYIGNYSYRNCDKLKKLTVVHTGDTYITSGNGESNLVLEELRLEGKIDIKGSPVFQNNYALKHVYLGEGIREVGERAFYKCYALETMYLADTITSIGDRAIDMEASGNQTSASFMFVDENGNMDNTMPTSLTYLGGHFLKHFTIANTQIIFPESFTSHKSEQKYDFEGTKYPEGFSIVYLGKMTYDNMHIFYQHNNSKDIAVYLTKNSPADIKNYRVEANVGTDGVISHGAYAGVNTNGTLEIYVDNQLHNYIKATEYVKFIFCGSDEVCFVTRVNIPWGENMATSWGNFVSTPVTYDELVGDYQAKGETAPAKHPMVSAPEFSDATCTQPGGLKTYCLACGQIATIEKTADALGHNLEYADGAQLISIVYNRFDENGVKTVACATCKDNCTVDALAIFRVLGSTSKEFGNSEISLAYEINRAAIADYELAGNTFKYGVYAVSEEKLGDNEIFGENGAFSGAFTKEITSYKNDAFELRLAGFTDAQKDKAFAMGAYVEVTVGGKKTYSYLQFGDETEGSKYTFVTYNQILG